MLRPERTRGPVVHHVVSIYIVRFCNRWFRFVGAFLRVKIKFLSIRINKHIRTIDCKNEQSKCVVQGSSLITPAIPHLCSLHRVLTCITTTINRDKDMQAPPKVLFRSCSRRSKPPRLTIQRINGLDFSKVVITIIRLVGSLGTRDDPR